MLFQQNKTGSKRKEWISLKRYWFYSWCSLCRYCHDAPVTRTHWSDAVSIGKKISMLNENLRLLGHDTLQCGINLPTINWRKNFLYSAFRRNILFRFSGQLWANWQRAEKNSVCSGSCTDVIQFINKVCSSDSHGVPVCWNSFPSIVQRHWTAVNE